MNKGLVIFIVALLVVVLVFAFSDNVNLSPKKNTKNTGLDMLVKSGSLDISDVNNYFIAFRFMGKENSGFSDLSSNEAVTDTNIINRFMKGGND